MRGIAAVCCGIGKQKVGMKIKEREAIVLREVALRFLATERIYSLCRWLNGEEVLTPARRLNRTKVLRDILSNLSISGQRAHKCARAFLKSILLGA